MTVSKEPNKCAAIFFLLDKVLCLYLIFEITAILFLSYVSNGNVINQSQTI